MQHGSIRAAARVLKIDHAYLWRLARGTKKEPSAEVLKKLGVRRIVTYQPIKPLPFAPDLSICEQHQSEIKNEKT